MEGQIKTIRFLTESLTSLRIEQREDSIEFYIENGEWPILSLTYEEMKEILLSLDSHSLLSEDLKEIAEKIS